VTTSALQALIFDVDGTVADTEEIHRQAFNAAFIELALWWDWSAPEYMQLLRVSGGPQRLAHYIETLSVPEGEKQRLRGLVPTIHATKTRLYRELIERGAPVRPGVLRLMKEARAAGLRLALGATSTTANVEALLSASLGREALGWFSAVASVDQVPNRKPAPDLYLRLLGELRLPASACVALEDSANGVQAAKAAGLYTIATPSRWTATQDFGAADLVLHSLGDPQAPLDLVSARAVGAPQLGVAQIARLHAAHAVA
jgi:HAD superfamily hydrolase (TIGR01509 family)